MCGSDRKVESLAEDYYLLFYVLKLYVFLNSYTCIQTNELLIVQKFSYLQTIPSQIISKKKDLSTDNTWCAIKHQPNKY